MDNKLLVQYFTYKFSENNHHSKFKTEVSYRIVQKTRKLPKKLNAIHLKCTKHVILNCCEQSIFHIFI